METKQHHANKWIINCIRYAGMYVGAIIGAGYASGQETLQFFVSYGYIGIVGTIIAVELFAWYGTMFMELGHKLHTNSHKEVFTYLCGPKVGAVFDWILVFFLFGVLSIMIAGGGASLNQYFGINLMFGRVIIAVLTVGTVILGFNSALNALGFLSPLIIIATLAISIGTISTNLSGISQAGANMQGLTIAKATPFWWSSAFIYISYCVLPAVPALASIGNGEKDEKLIRKSGILGGSLLGVAILFMVLATLSRIVDVSAMEVPFLEVARQMSPVIGGIFAFILLFAVYTTSVPILYGFSVRFAEDGTTKFKILTLVAGCVAFVAGLVPFSKLVGTVYPLLGYLGLVIMAVGFYKTVIKRPGKKEQANDTTMKGE